MSKDMSKISNLNRYKVQRGQLIAGAVDDNHFYLLVDIVGVRNKQMVLALRDYLVLGKSRKISCGEHKVSQSYFSIKLYQLEEVSKLIASSYIYYLCTDKI